jgi:hypothetical protein
MFFVPLWSQFVDDNIEIYLSLSAIALRSICKVYQVDGYWGRADVPVLDGAKHDSIVKCKRERTTIEWARVTKCCLTRLSYIST